jgi:hypothetical protein
MNDFTPRDHGKNPLWRRVALVATGTIAGLGFSYAIVSALRNPCFPPARAGATAVVATEDPRPVETWPPPYFGERDIPNETAGASVRTQDATPLDGRSLEEILAFRKERVERQANLGLFPTIYDPMSGHARRIYASITPGAKWLGPTVYYIANPYVLVVATCANHVTPLNLLCPETRIRYSNRRIVETHGGESAACWLKRVHDPSYADQAGQVDLVTVNADDAGYRHAHVDPARSANLEAAADPASIMRGLFSSTSFYHFGRYQANNISPRDERRWVRLREAAAPTRIVVKLWRNRPSAPESDADLVYEIVVDPDLE